MCSQGGKRFRIRVKVSEEGWDCGTSNKDLWMACEYKIGISTKEDMLAESDRERIIG